MSNELIPITYNDKRILTTEQIAMVYETESRRITENFNRNKKRFIEGKHFYLLKGEKLKAFKGEYANSVVAPNVNKLYLWTERGADRHCKILDTDKAWEQFDHLEETYFRVKEGNYSQSKLEDNQSKDQQAPHNIVKKFYNGNPVMVLKDLEAILNVPVGNLSYYLRKNRGFTMGIDYFLLEGKELKRFKEYNNVSPFIGNLIIMPKQGVDKLVKLLVLKEEDIRQIEEYFKVETKEPHNNMPILEQLQVCKFIADDFKINEAIKMSIYKMICQKNGIGSEIVGMISIEETRDKFVKLAVEYLSNFTTDILIKAKRELIFRDEFISSPHETKGLILGFFDIVIEASKENAKTAV